MLIFCSLIFPINDSALIFLHNLFQATTIFGSPLFTPTHNYLWQPTIYFKRHLFLAASSHSNSYFSLINIELFSCINHIATSSLFFSSSTIMFCSLSFLGNSYTACSKSLASIAQAQRLIVLTFGSNQLI